MHSFRYKSLIDSSGDSILCEEINFENLQSFLYFNFFNGIENNCIPNKCKNCGKFFLIQDEDMMASAKMILSGRLTIEHTKLNMIDYFDKIY